MTHEEFVANCRMEYRKCLRKLRKLHERGGPRQPIQAVLEDAKKYRKWLRIAKHEGANAGVLRHDPEEFQREVRRHERILARIARGNYINVASNESPEEVAIELEEGLAEYREYLAAGLRCWFDVKISQLLGE